MFLNDFNQTPGKKIAKLNKMLKEQFNVSVSGFPSRRKLEIVLERTEKQLISIRGNKKKFHLDPEYAKFLGIRDIVDTMIHEGMYAESPRYMEMKGMINASVQDLMDAGYTMDEACSECMNRYRQDNRFAYDDEHVLPIVLQAAQDYMESCQTANEEVENSVMDYDTDLNEKLLAALAEECGVKLENSQSYDAIEEKIGSFAKAVGKSRDAVVGFLNGLDENNIRGGIQMFGRKVAEANKFTQARKAAIQSGKKEFKVDGVTYPVTGDPSGETTKELEESMSSKNSRAVANVSRSVLYQIDSVISDVKKGKLTPEQAILSMKKLHPDVIQALRSIRAVKEGSVSKVNGSGNHNETMFDNLISDLLREEVDVEQAEVVMAVKALGDDIQDQVERLGRMINEDLPAITDQMRGEMGASTAQNFYDSLSQTLQQHLDATRQLKNTVDQSVSGMTGQGDGLDDSDLGGDVMDPGLGDDMENLDDISADPDAEIDPAAAGTDEPEEPLGRAAI